MMVVPVVTLPLSLESRVPCERSIKIGPSSVLRHPQHLIGDGSQAINYALQDRTRLCVSRLIPSEVLSTGWPIASRRGRPAAAPLVSLLFFILGITVIALFLASASACAPSPFAGATWLLPAVESASCVAPTISPPRLRSGAVLVASGAPTSLPWVGVTHAGSTTFILISLADVFAAPPLRAGSGAPQTAGAAVAPTILLPGIT